MVLVDEHWVEIQVRSDLQHLWAQVMERLGDAWGRQLQYGEGPTDPQAIARVGPGITMTRNDLVAEIMAVSDRIEKVERATVSYRLLKESPPWAPRRGLGPNDPPNDWSVPARLRAEFQSKLDELAIQGTELVEDLKRLASATPPG